MTMDLSLNTVKGAPDIEKIEQSIRAELEAIQLYREIRDTTSNRGIEWVFNDILEEEQRHIGEFLYLIKEHTDSSLPIEIKNGLVEACEVEFPERKGMCDIDLY